MKQKIIDLLKQNENQFISGQKISESLGVSRAAIWKYMNLIKEDGYEIESVSRKGYKLVMSPDILTSSEIKGMLNTKVLGNEIIHLDSVDSTNNKAKQLAACGAIEGTIVISEEQTSGKGRLGRNWVSPKYKGIWMSMILRPDINPMNVAKVTQVAAAAVIEALKEMDIQAFIKWPNDIVINSKKICGVLTEMSGEINKVNYVVVGMGINANLEEQDFSQEIKNKASSLKVETREEINRKQLVANILNKFEKLYDELILEEKIDTSIKICRENSALIGKEVRIIERNKEVIATALDLSEDGKLVVQYKDGRIDEIISGEISVRGLEGYV